MRLIDADELITPSGGYNPIKWCHEYGDVVSLEDIHHAPTVEKRPKGEWLLYGMIYYCSECGHDCEQGGNNYCGNCGADMREEAEDENN